MWKKDQIEKKKKIIFITGPTTSGKSDYALFLAKKINGEIINADSRQVYKYLDIGSGKITKKEQSEIKHYLLSIASPRKNYSLGRWLNDAEKAIKEIFKKNKVPIFCGGTILYLKAIKEGWQLPQVRPDYKLRKKLEKKTKEELYQQIKQLDPQRAKTLDPKNKRRLIRALEIVYSLHKVPKLIKKPKYQLLVLAPKIEKEILFKRIKKRLLKRVPAIIKEIKILRKLGLSLKRIINFGLEYKWFGLYVKETSKTKLLNHQAKNLLFQVIDRCYYDILRFAKRQMRELKKIEGLIWFEKKRQLLDITEKFVKNLE